MEKNPNRFPPGWDEARVQRVLAHYENQTGEEEVAHRLETIQRAARHEFPSGNIDQMLGEIERGYCGSTTN